jgi:hypothetical protein
VTDQKYIAFIGDSFCASYGPSTSLSGNKYQASVVGTAYPTVVGDHYQYAVAPYGFVGTSWWYSWSKFYKDWASRLDQIEAIVFTHTECARINSAVSDELPLMNSASVVANSMARVNKDYFKYIHDQDFNLWAQEQYFKMLKEKFNNIRTIHLHCYDFSVQQSYLLPGMVFTTSLTQISVGETKGPKKEIIKAFGDGRPNHMNCYNNQVLADTIIQALDNYVPGEYKLPLEKFQQPNPNAANWPHGVYWTE